MRAVARMKKNGQSLLSKGKKVLIEGGLIAVLKKIFTHIRYKLQKYFSVEQSIFREKSTKITFSKIYANNYWDNAESVSGSGSTLAYTENLRRQLPVIFEEYDIKVLLDTPCGDFNWMKEVMKECPKIKYIGGDIVDEIIHNNIACYSNRNIAFQVLDITRDELCAADLIIVRDCLFHLSFSDINLFLRNLSRSSIRYLLTTSYDIEGGIVNANIKTGEFREVNLFLPPFNFPSLQLCCIDDWVPPFPSRKMYLFKVATIPDSLDLIQG